MRPKPLRSLAAVGATALALTACGGAGEPSEVVADGLAARFDQGAAFTLSVDGDLAALSDEPPPPEVEALFGEGLISGAFGPDGGFALTLGPGAGFFEVRAVEEALYLRVDLDELASLSPDIATGLPSRADLQAQLGQLGLGDDIAALAQTVLDGGWIGITGLSQDSIESLTGDLGMPTADPEQQEQFRDLMEERDLLDGEGFTDTYLVVEGDGPTYDVTLRARALFQAFTEIAAEAQESFGGGMMAPQQELPDMSEVPEEISGVTITVEDGAVTRISGDLADLARSAGEDTGDLGSGDVSVHLDLEDLGDQLDVPEGAPTIAFDQLLQAAMGAFFGGLGQGMGDMGDMPSLEDLEDMAPEDLQDLENMDPQDLEELEELLSDMPTAPS